MERVEVSSTTANGDETDDRQKDGKFDGGHDSGFDVSDILANYFSERFNDETSEGKNGPGRNAVSFKFEVNPSVGMVFIAKRFTTEILIQAKRLHPVRGPKLRFLRTTRNYRRNGRRIRNLTRNANTAVGVLLPRSPKRTEIGDQGIRQLT